VVHIEFGVLVCLLLWLIRRIPPPTVITANLNGMQRQFDLVTEKLDKVLEKLDIDGAKQTEEDSL
jgi:hypothetical protein